MPSRRRSRNKNLRNNISEVQRRLRYLERRPARTKLSERVVSKAAISPRAVGPEQADFGIPIVKPPGSEAGWENGLVNPKDGDLIIDPDNGSTKAYDESSDSFITLSDPVAAASATTAFNAAVAAGTAAGTAQTTANGKNKVVYSTSAPGATANTAGDVWFQYGTAAPNVNRIIAQFIGAGGTSWTQTTVSGLVVANIDAGSITTGILSVGLGITTGTGTFTVNAITGALFANSAAIQGTINATSGFFGSSTNGFSISATGLLGVGTGTIVGGAISGTTFTNGSTFSVTSGGVLTATSGTIGGFTLGATFLSGGGFAINSTSGTGTFNALTANGNLFAKSGLILETGVSTVSAGGNTFNNVGHVNIPTGDLTLVSGRVTTNLLTVGNTATMNGDVNLGASQELRVPFAFNTTTASSPNVFITSTGQFRRHFSSIRYKENVVDIQQVPELDPKKLLEIPVRAFMYKQGSVEAGDDREGTFVPGLIAEEVDAIYPLATDYSDGQIQNINDRAILVNLLALVQDLYKEIAILKGE